MENLDLYHYIIATGVIIAFVRFRRLESLLRTLSFFLLLTFLVECATPLRLIRFHGNNSWFFNIFTTIEFLYYSFIFYQLFQSRSLKKGVAITTGLFLIFTCINILFIQGFKKFHTISYRVGAVMIIVWCCLYFRQLMQSSEYIVLARNPYFWISTGLLFFYLGFFFYFSAFDYIVYRKVKFSLALFNVISDTLNILLYSCFVIALLCPKKHRPLYKS